MSPEIPSIPLNVRLRHYQGHHLAIGYEHTLELSPTALFIWNTIDGKTSVSGIAQAVSDEYGIDTRTALADTSSLLDDLVRHQLVQWSTED
jgi:hypothetical protein